MSGQAGTTPIPADARRLTRRLVVGAILPVVWATAPLGAQGLHSVAEAAKTAWLSHDIGALIGEESFLTLRIPGSDPSSPLERGRAKVLLHRYLEPSREISWETRAVRELDAGRGYVEALRRYTVKGTEDERWETVFLAYRRDGDVWLLQELRIYREHVPDRPWRRRQLGPVPLR